MTPPRRAGRSPSAALVMGVLSGCVAAIAVLPTSIPLTQRLNAAEAALTLRHVTNGAAIAQRLLESGQPVTQGTRAELGLDHLQITAEDGLIIYQEGPDLSPTLAQKSCQATTAIIADDDQGQKWSIVCVDEGKGRVIAAWAIRGSSSTRLIYLVLALAAIVGIITALGVLRILSPLSTLSSAIVRVGAGERGVHLPVRFGFAELDELVDQMNMAARAMEDREDAILGRIKAVQNMARMVAHEVRNPLQSLELLTSLIASENNAEERHALALAIHAEIHSLDQVVTRVLREGASAGALHLPLHRNRVAVAPIITHLVALRTPEAKAHGIALEKGPLPDIRASVDGALFARSIENLLLNAMQVVPPARGRVRISMLVEDNTLVIAVEDNGPGVDPALANHIFEPNVSGRTGGTGLGLALVKEVVEAHRGTIVQDRSPLGGARFTVRLPLEVEGDREDTPPSADRR